MWQKIKKVLSVLLYPLLLLAGILVGKRFICSGDVGRRDLERAHAELDAAERSAAEARSLVDGLERDVAALRESGRDAGRKLKSAQQRADKCTAELKSLREEIGRARDKGEECSNLLTEHAGLSERAGKLIAELQQRYGEGGKEPQDSEHMVDNPHSYKRISGDNGSGD